MLLYALTIFLSAFLLCQVQPIIAKIILPWFGGSSAVWTTCMLFFQSVLFLGYLEMGDARLVLESEPPQQFDLLVMDAFSEDSAPVHLVTREAFRQLFPASEARRHCGRERFQQLSESETRHGGGSRGVRQGGDALRIHSG